MSAIIVFDADNTLWDTNAVFTQAQLNLLRVFAEAGFLKSAEAELDTLREIDRALIKATGEFEYDFTLLSVAIALYYSRMTSVEQVADLALTHTESVAESLIADARDAFESTLQTVPSLFPGTEEMLRNLKSSRLLGRPILLILFTDGERSRIQRILDAHSLRESVFADIIIDKKTVESFQRVRLSGLNRLQRIGDSEAKLFMIGDSLKRDIAPSKQAGFTTIYKPAHFLGCETPNNRYETPDFTINSLSELSNVLAKMGLPLDDTHKHTQTKAAKLSD